MHEVHSVVVIDPCGIGPFAIYELYTVVIGFSSSKGSRVMKAIVDTFFEAFGLTKSMNPIPNYKSIAATAYVVASVVVGITDGLIRG
jgi:hypothetical protein